MSSPDSLTVHVLLAPGSLSDKVRDALNAEYAERVGIYGSDGSREFETPEGNERDAILWASDTGAMTSDLDTFGEAISRWWGVEAVVVTIESSEMGPWESEVTWEDGAATVRESHLVPVNFTALVKLCERAGADAVTALELADRAGAEEGAALRRLVDTFEQLRDFVRAVS